MDVCIIYVRSHEQKLCKVTMFMKVCKKEKQAAYLQEKCFSIAVVKVLSITNQSGVMESVT